MINILITGSAGFIGFNLQKYLSKYYRVVGCDNLSSVSKKTQKLRLNQIKKSKLKFIKIDLNNSQNLKKKLKGYRFDLIIHLAATPGVRVSQTFPQSTISNNLISFINVFEYAVQNNINKVFYASSSSVYGNNKSFIEKNTKLDPTSIYGVSKVANEYLARTYNKLYDISSIGLRFFTVYGPWGREDMSYFKFFNDIYQKNQIEIYGDKRSKRSFTHINDIIIMINKLINKFEKKKNFLEVINLGNDKTRSLKELVEIIKNKTKKSFKEKKTTRNKSDAIFTSSNNKKIYSLIKYKPKVNLENGIDQFYKWYLEKILKNKKKN